MAYWPLRSLNLEVIAPTYRDFEDGLNKVRELLEGGLMTDISSLGTQWVVQ